MHPSARENAALFFDAYVTAGEGKIIEIGSQDVNGSLRDLSPVGMTYTGVDFVPGQGVDVVLDDPYGLPFENESQDVVISSSCFEHSQLFWLLFLEIMRILRPDGVFYLNVPSNGYFHRYPVDCWRFYPDSGRALIEWARRCGHCPLLLESFVSTRRPGAPWNDFVAVFLKDESYVSKFPHRIIHRHWGYYNGLLHGDAEGVVRHYSLEPEPPEPIICQKPKEKRTLSRFLRSAGALFGKE